MAEEFDTQYRIDRAQIIADTIKKELNLPEMTNVMEFGCGTGLITLNLLDSLQAITLVDSSKGMLTVLKDKINKINSNKQISIYNDINSYELLIESFDCIFSSMVLHHISNIPKYCNRFFQLIKQNGFLCVIDLSPVDKMFHKNEIDFTGYNGFNSKDLSIEIQKHGFIELVNKEIYSNSKIIEDKKIKYSLFMLILQKI